MARFHPSIRTLLTGKGLLLWLVCCVAGASANPGRAASLTASQTPTAVSSNVTPLLKAHGSHCEWRVGRDARVGYSHRHMHIEDCNETNKADSADRPLGSYDRHDKKTSTRKTAGERERERRRAPPEDAGKPTGSTADEGKARDGKAHDRKSDDSKIDEAMSERRKADQKDEKEAALAPRPRMDERPERPRCRTRETRPKDECPDDPPPPYRRHADEGPQDEDPDGLEKARCGMLCMWRRAKYGHCGVGCSYYRRRYEGDGRDDWRSGDREEYSRDGERDRLK